MKKNIIFFLLVISLMFVSTNIVSAYSFLGNFFGGRIIDTKAWEIRELEDFGYICDESILGSSIEISPIGSPFDTPTSYFIPNFITSKTTGDTPGISQLIIGRYAGETSISCTHPESGDTQIVILDTINLFGTSRGFNIGGGGGAAKAVPSGPASR